MWKMTGRRNLPMVDDDSWYGDAAAHDIFAWAGYPDDFNPSQAAGGFMVHDTEDPENLGSFKLPFAKVVDGRLKASKSGISAVKQRLSATDIPTDLKDTVMAACDKYQGMMKKAGMMGKETPVYTYTWVGFPMNAWEDRDPEKEHRIIPLKLIESDIAYQAGRIEAGSAQDYGPLQVRHKDDLEIGRVLVREVLPGTRTTIEAGTIADPNVGEMLYTAQEHGKEWRMSHRYHFLMRAKEYIGIRKFESTLTTPQYATNTRTRFRVVRVEKAGA